MCALCEADCGGGAAHPSGRDDDFVGVRPALGIVPGFAGRLDLSIDDRTAREAGTSLAADARPLVSPDVLDRADAALGRRVRSRKRGPKRKMRGRADLAIHARSP